MRTYYLMWRGWLDNPTLGGKREPHNRRSAWAWLIENAAYKAHTMTVAGREIRVERGQLYVAMRALAREWGWAEPKVRRFLQATHQVSMTECVADAHGVLITICNYDKYQDVGSVTDAPTDAPVTHQPTHSKKEIKQGYEDSPDGESPPPIVPPPPGRGDRKTRRRQAKRISPGWMPSAEGRAFAEQLGLDAEAAAVEFRDYWIAESGARAAKLDWEATFRNRCRTLAAHGRGHVAGPRANGHRASPVENLYLGAWNAAAKFDEADRQSGDCGPGEPPVGPLLDRRRLSGS